MNERRRYTYMHKRTEDKTVGHLNRLEKRKAGGRFAE
jgi:hypothetical protein